MELTRRSVVRGAGVVIGAGLAGCGGGGGEDTPTETTAEPTETTAEPTATATATPNVEVFADEEVHLEVGHYETYRVYRDSPFRLAYEFEVVSGPGIDVFVLTHEELNKYESEIMFAVEAQTLDATSGSNDVELSSGTYHVAVDNTSAGEATPGEGLNQNEDDVDVQIRATAEPTS